MNDDFFVGTPGRRPARDAGLMRGVAAVFVVVVAAAAALMVFAQPRAIKLRLAGTMIEVTGPAERVGSFVVVRVASHRRL